MCSDRTYTYSHHLLYKCALPMPFTSSDIHHFFLSFFLFDEIIKHFPDMCMRIHIACIADKVDVYFFFHLELSISSLCLHESFDDFQKRKEITQIHGRKDWFTLARVEGLCEKLTCIQVEWELMGKTHHIEYIFVSVSIYKNQSKLFMLLVPLVCYNSVRQNNPI